MNDLDAVWTQARVLAMDMRESLDPAPLAQERDKLLERMSRVDESDILSTKHGLQYMNEMLQKSTPDSVQLALRMNLKLLADVKKSETLPTRTHSARKRPRPQCSPGPPFRKPVGRPPKNKTWDENTGDWIFVASLAEAGPEHEEEAEESIHRA